MKKPISILSKLKIINKLDRLRANGDDPVAIIDQSIANGWQGVFPLRCMGEIRHDAIKSGQVYLTPHQKLMANNRRALEEWLSDINKSNNKNNKFCNLSVGVDS